MNRRKMNIHRNRMSGRSSIFVYGLSVDPELCSKADVILQAYIAVCGVVEDGSRVQDRVRSAGKELEQIYHRSIARISHAAIASLTQCCQCITVEMRFRLASGCQIVVIKPAKV